MGVLVQPELETALSASEYSALRAGIFQGIGVSIRCGLWESAKEDFGVRRHRRYESEGLIAIPRAASFRFTRHDPCNSWASWGVQLLLCRDSGIPISGWQRESLPRDSGYLAKGTRLSACTNSSTNEHSQVFAAKPGRKLKANFASHVTGSC